MKVTSPKSTKEFKHEDAVFTVGVLPYGKRVEMESLTHFAKKVENPEQVRAILNQAYEFVRCGIKGHTGLTLENGESVPFALDKEGNVSEETMAVYCATPGLLTVLSGFVTEFNYVSKETAKN